MAYINENGRRGNVIGIDCNSYKIIETHIDIALLLLYTSEFANYFLENVR